MKNLKNFKSFESIENVNKLLDNDNLDKSELANQSRNIEGNIIDEFYKQLGDRKFKLYPKDIEDTDLSTIYIEYDVILLNLIYPANDKEYCYYTRKLYTSDVTVSTQTKEGTKKVINMFDSLSLEKQVHYLTFNGGVFKKQKRLK